MLRSLLATLVSCFAAAAQNFFVPDNGTSGGCEIVPFGDGSPSQIGNHRYQTRLTAAQLGGAPGICTGLGFLPCGATAPGGYGIRLDQLRIVMDHIPPSQPLSTTFANNLTPAAVTVLDVVDREWVVGPTWLEVGQQFPFVFNGVDDVVVDITTVSAWAVQFPSGFRTGGLPRLYWFGQGTPPATGTLDNNGLRIEVSMGMARVASLGMGCGGWSGPLRMGAASMPVPGSTVTFTLQEAVAGTFAVFVAGTTDAVPLLYHPSPACRLYTDLMFTAVVPVTGPLPPTGPSTAQYSVPIPPGLLGFRFCTQFAMWPAGSWNGVATSNYVHLLTGN
jgi:hypothetical protein